MNIHVSTFLHLLQLLFPTSHLSFSLAVTLMASRFFDRSRSRTRAPSSTRPSRSSTDRPATDFLETLPQHARDAFNAQRYYSRPPKRQSLTIIDFRDPAELAYIPEPLRQNADLLADSKFDCLGCIETACLFTRCRHLTFEDVTRTPVGNLCNLISIRLRGTWDLNISSNDLELRFTDLWGDVFQLDMTRAFLRLWMFGDLAGRNFKLVNHLPFPSHGAQGTHLFSDCRVTAAFLP